MDNYQVDAIVSLLKDKHFVFIESLLKNCFITKDIFITGIQKYYKFGWSEHHVLVTIKLIDNFYGFDLDNDQDILSSSITQLVNYFHDISDPEWILCFKKLVDMNASIKYIECSRVAELPPDMFFYYINKNDFDIKSYVLSLICCHNSSDPIVYDWIIEQYIDSDVSYALKTSCRIMRIIYFRNNEQFMRMMQKIYSCKIIHLIIFDILCHCKTDHHDTINLIPYIQECEHCDELLFLRFLLIPSHNTTESIDSVVAKDMRYTIDCDINRYKFSGNVEKYYAIIIQRVTSLMNIHNEH